MIEAGAVVFPRDRRCQLHQLGIAEMFAKSFEEFIRNDNGCLRHGLGIVQNKPLDFAEHRGMLILNEGRQMFVAQTLLSADRRPEIDSEGASDEHRHFDFDHRLQTRVHRLSGFLP